LSGHDDTLILTLERYVPPTMPPTMRLRVAVGLGSLLSTIAGEKMTLTLRLITVALPRVGVIDGSLHSE
jgi:hypothetical protein